MIDSLASSITDMKQAQIQQAASVSVLRTSLDAAKDQSAQLIKLLDAATTVSDAMLGTRVDTYA